MVKDLSEEEAVIWMVDSNIQRTDILPSEKAKAYRMKMDALSKQGYRTDLLPEDDEDDASRQVVGRWKKESAEQVGTENGDSGRQVQRYLRLNYLIPDLLDRGGPEIAGVFWQGWSFPIWRKIPRRHCRSSLRRVPERFSLKQARHLKEQEQQEKTGDADQRGDPGFLISAGKEVCRNPGEGQGVRPCRRCRKGCI